MGRPRIRSIKPEMWADERIGHVSRDARLLFVGLITMADDEGRLRELPLAILGHVFPYDDLTVRRLETWLEELACVSLIVRYGAGGKRYVVLPGWTKHQKINRATDSELPAPPIHDSLSESSVNGHGARVT